MIERVQNVFYRVADLNRAAGFYGDVLGLKLKFRDADNWAEYDLGNVSLGLETAQGSQAGGSSGGAVVVLRGPDLDGLLGKVRQAGGALLGEIEQRPYGRIARFTDLDGNELNYLEPTPK